MRSKPGPVDNRTLPSAKTLAQVSDALAWPLLLMHADSTLLHANEAGRALLRQGQPLRLSTLGAVRPARLRHRAAYRQAFGAALAGQPTRLLRWPAFGSGQAWCGLLRPLPQVEGQAAAQLLVLCRDTGIDNDLLALLSLRPPLVPPTPEGE